MMIKHQQLDKQAVFLLIVCIGSFSILMTILFIGESAHGQIFPKNNTQSTSPNNRTSIMVIINHGAANYTISDFIPTLIPNKCPMTAHIIDNNNSTSSDPNIVPAKPVIICYI